MGDRKPARASLRIAWAVTIQEAIDRADVHGMLHFGAHSPA